MLRTARPKVGSLDAQEVDGMKDNQLSCELHVTKSAGLTVHCWAAAS